MDEIMEVNASVALTNGRQRAYVVTEAGVIAQLNPGESLSLHTNLSYAIYATAAEACAALRRVVEGDRL